MSDNKIKLREEKWQKRWADAKCWTPKDDGIKPKFFNLFEFPFPSGNGLHVGHLVPYVSMDIMARFRRMQGFDVLFPLGLDSMGIAAEHYAKKVNKTPAESVDDLTKIFDRDAAKIGLSVDPESFLRTSDPKFIKWTQWIFIQLFKAGLAYKDEYPMNWCPSCEASFTNEELDGLPECPRCHGKIEQKNKMQWMMAITKYADRLIDDLALVDYPERVKTATINWVGRSSGTEIDFKVGDDVMTVYTTRVDTVFGVTFCVIAPEHKLVQKWLDENKIKNFAEVKKYIAESADKDEFDRTNADKEKTGVLLDGIMAVNPFNKNEIPVFIADYVLANYGFGTIMAVPAHDQRDYDFAKKFGLSVIQVLDNGDISECAQAGDGLHINSEYLNGLNKIEAINKAIEQGADFARSAKQYKMRDWAFSRQMYWGEPIPLVYCEEHGWVPIPESELPLELPHLTDYTPTEYGEGPLARATDWVKTKCPVCGKIARRETDTMPGWAGSSWYFMRYLDVNNDKEFCSRAKLDKLMPVDHYNGPMEHVTKHLIYSRFWYKALYDLGFVPGVEPYKKRTLNGLMMAPDGRKMSKSLGNLVASNDVVERSGADVCRMTILFLAPFGQNMNWSEDTLRGCERFLKRVENMFDNIQDLPMDFEQERLVNQLIKDVSERIENMQFNTTISAMMEFLNEFGNVMPRRAYEILLQCLNPLAPHLTEEMWEKLGHKDMLVFEPFPKFDESKLVKTTKTIVVSVNGKRRGEIVVGLNSAQSEIESAARAVAEKFLTAEIVKTIFVPNKMINFVIKG